MLKELFLKYFKEIDKIRENEIDAGNLDFHRKNELYIKAPQEWETKKNLSEALDKLAGQNIFIFYSDTPCYSSFYELISDRLNSNLIEFTSFFELHSAILNANQDIRLQRKIQNNCSHASIVIVLDISRCPEIVRNAIRQFSNGSLVLID